MSGYIFFCLDPFEQRTKPNLSGPAIADELNKQFGSIQDAFILAVPPPPVMGLGAIGGFKLFVEDRADLGYDELYQNVQGILAKGSEAPGLAGVFPPSQSTSPNSMPISTALKPSNSGVPLQNLFETMQIYLGSLYVNDFNRFGRTYQVVGHADAEFRDRPEDITRLKTRNAKGEMVSLGSLVKVSEVHGPDRVMRYNGLPADEIHGGPAPGFSSGQAESLISRLAHENLPNGMTIEWTDLTLQRLLAGTRVLWLSGLPVLGFVVLAAQYERVPLPFAIFSSCHVPVSA